MVTRERARMGCAGGAPFDPLDLGGDADAFEAARVQEVLVGRLAMLACAGLGAQALATRAGPVANLLQVLGVAR